MRRISVIIPTLATVVLLLAGCDVFGLPYPVTPGQEATRQAREAGEEAGMKKGRALAKGEKFQEDPEVTARRQADPIFAEAFDRGVERGFDAELGIQGSELGRAWFYASLEPGFPASGWLPDPGENWSERDKHAIADAVGISPDDWRLDHEEFREQIRNGVAWASYYHQLGIPRRSCFAAGTSVLMADGSTKPIEAIRPGDRVRGRNGAINTVTRVERPRLAGRLLYGFDGGRPFVTAEHPFLTAEGWKAIDPAATRAENPALAVGALVAGDRLAVVALSAAAVAQGGTGFLAVRYAPAEPPAVAYRALGRITAVRADPDTVVYNLLLDGDHSYFADGYLVHNKDGDQGGGEGDE
jgi:hypothetical protein